MHLPAIRNIISGTALLIALVIAAGVPAGYFAVGSADAAEALAFKARLSATRSARYIFRHEQMWQYQKAHLAELIGFPEDAGEPVRQRITDLSDKVVLQEKVDLAGPVRHVRVPITVGDETVGGVSTPRFWTVSVALGLAVAFHRRPGAGSAANRISV